MVSYDFDVQKLIENDRISGDNITEIKIWCENESTVPNLSDQQISLFLIACDNVIENTKKCITCFYQVRSQSGELFDKRDVSSSELQSQLKLFYFCVLPGRTKDNHAVVFSRLSDPCPATYQMVHQFTLLFMTFEIVLHKEPPNGIILLFDMANISMGHLLKIKINIIRKALRYVQDGMMVKIKEIHILNSNWLCQKLLVIAKPFMYQELLNKIHFHCTNINMEEFYEKCIPKSVMPSNYGGDGPSIEDLHAKTCETLSDMTQHFNDEIAQRKSLKKT